ncbi:MAG: multicopper oxidase domain-containing protein, partial [Pseudomonadota bacterium]
MNRRQFLAGSTAIGLGLTGFARAQSSPRALPIPELVDLMSDWDERIQLKFARSTHDFGNGAISETFGINRSYLGPVLRTKQGQTLPFDVKNELGEGASVHWHGLHIPGDVDGGPHQEIEDGATWSPDVPIVQHASMNWFHSHTHGTTARQTYNGLAGILLVEDDASLSADLPKTYGVDDFTLVLQDKAFDAQGKMSYELTGEVFEDGFQGETLVINGAIAPVAQSVPNGLVRLRLLNACNARFLEISMQNGPVTVIASDGGFLSSSVQVDSILMSPGERYEILADLRSGQGNALLVNLDGGGGGFLTNLFWGSSATTVLELVPNGASGFDGSVPDSLANLS